MSWKRIDIQYIPFGWQVIDGEAIMRQPLYGIPGNPIQTRRLNLALENIRVMEGRLGKRPGWRVNKKGLKVELTYDPDC